MRTVRATRYAAVNESGAMTLMQPRVNYRKAAPQGLAKLADLQKYVDGCGLEHPLIELVKMRASQLNGCAYCMDMHSKDARSGGESEQRLYLLSAWREAPFYSDRERAALAWTEAVTKIAEKSVEDKLYEEVRRYFNEKEVTDLTFAIIAINAWNRLAISFRATPGSYQPVRATKEHGSAA